MQKQYEEKAHEATNQLISKSKEKLWSIFEDLRPLSPPEVTCTVEEMTTPRPNNEIRVPTNNKTRTTSKVSTNSKTSQPLQEEASNVSIKHCSAALLDNPT